jgi:type IV pilus assembly protein PilC
MFNSLTKSVPLRDKILFYESIANLLDGGVTLLSGLKGFASRLEPGNFREIVDNTIFFVEQGDMMNIAMRKLPHFYGEKEIAIVESGEQTGMLRTTFEAIANELRMQDDLRQKVVSSLTYPFIIMFFLVLSLVVVMAYVIPQIMPIIAEMTTDIPWSTRSLIAVSSFFQHNIIWIFLILVAFGLIFYGFSSTEQGKRWIDREKLFLPLTGKIYRNYMITQVMSTLHLLLGSGVSILRTIELSGASSGNLIVQDMYMAIRDSVAHGQKITESIQNVDPTGILFPPDIVQMIESGEKTSTLHEVAAKISKQYRREVDNSLGVMVKFIEPAALLIA